MTWIILGVIALIVIFVIVSYNGLVKNRMQTKEAWSQKPRWRPLRCDGAPCRAYAGGWRPLARAPF